MTETGRDELHTRTETLAHFTLADGRAFSLARTHMVLARAHGIGHAYVTRVSLSDVGRRRCTTMTVADRRAPAILREHLDPERAARRPNLRALDEVLATGRLP